MNKYIVGILFLMASPAFSADLLLDDFSGGLNTMVAPHKLQKNQTPNAENGYIDNIKGSITKRKGMIVAGRNPYLTKINFMKEFVPSVGAHGFFQSDSSRVTYTTDFTNYTVVKETMTQTAKLNATQGKGYMLFCNGNDPCFISNGGVGIPLDGNNGRPNVPRGKYTAFYQERFFVYNTTENTSALHWMEQSSTSGYVVPINDSYAWPWSNQLVIGDNDGAEGSGMDVYRSQLRLHKYNKSIYTLFGIDETDYNAQRTNAHSGTVSQDSIIQNDNLQYYFQNLGEEAFDGGDSARISDDVFDDMALVASNLSNIVANTWDSKSEWQSKGTFYNTEATEDGNLILKSTLAIVTITTNAGNDFIREYSQEWGVAQGTFTTFSPFQSTSAASDLNWSGIVTTMTAYSFTCSGCTTDNFIRLRLRNLRTGQHVETSSSTKSNSPTGFTHHNFTVPNATPFNITAADIRSGDFQIQTNVEVPGSAVTFRISSITYYQSGTVWASTDAGKYVSEITTVSTVTNWDIFDSNFNTSGGDIDYFIHGATSVVNVSTETYSNIISGNQITLPVAKKYVQFESSINATGLSVTTAPYVNFVSIKHNEGGSSDSLPFGIEWDKRYWLFVTTETSGNSTIVWLKSLISNSNPNAYMKFTFANDYFKSAAKFNNNFYVGSGSTGTVYRMDYETNDNGYSINWFYETPEFDMGQTFKEKIHNHYLFDLEKQSGGTLDFGLAVNGSSVAVRSFSINGTGRMLKLLNHQTSLAFPSNGFFFKYRFANSQSDMPMTFHKFHAVYADTDRKPNP